MKILIGENTNRILGAHLLMPHAEEVINVLTFAMMCNLTADTFKKMAWTFPSFCHDVKDVFD